MRIPRIDDAMRTCEVHLLSTGSVGTSIENVLVYSLLVIISSEFEQRTRAIIREKCASIEDDAIRTFVESCIGIVTRNINSSELAGLVNRFGDQYKAEFNRKCLGNQSAVTSYNSIITNRHYAVHSTGSNTTFLEVKTYYEQGHVVLDLFRETLLSIDPAHLPDSGITLPQ